MFHSQECFKGSWASHKLLHKKASRYQKSLPVMYFVDIKLCVGLSDIIYIHCMIFRLIVQMDMLEF